MRTLAIVWILMLTVCVVYLQMELSTQAEFDTATNKNIESIIGILDKIAK